LSESDTIGVSNRKAYSRARAGVMQGGLLAMGGVILSGGFYGAVL